MGAVAPRRLGMLLALLALAGPACAQDATPSSPPPPQGQADADSQPQGQARPAKKAPSFGVAGIRGTTAPSGYSSGASEESSSRAMEMVVRVPAAEWRIADPGQPQWKCDAEARLAADAESHPASFAAQHDLGLFYLQHGETAQSLRPLEKAEELQPADPPNSRTLALAYMAAGRPSDAATVLQRDIQEHADDAAARVLLAEANEATNDQPAALAEYKTAAGMRLSPEAQLDSALGLLRLGALREAEEMTRASLAHDPSSAWLWMALGIAQAFEQRTSDAAQSLLRAAHLDPSIAAPESFLVNLTGLPDDVRRRITETARQFASDHPQSAVGHYNYAVALLKQQPVTQDSGAATQAKEELQRAIQIDPHLAQARYQLGQVYFDEGDCARAAQELRRTVDAEPGHAAWHYLLFQAYKCNQQPALANRELMEFESLNRDDRREGGPMRTTQPWVNMWTTPEEPASCYPPHP